MLLFISCNVYIILSNTQAIPLDPSNPEAQAGPLTKRFADTIMGIQYGEIPHKWSVVV